jgi:hypothetical protein
LESNGGANQAQIIEPFERGLSTQPPIGSRLVVGDDRNATLTTKKPLDQSKPRSKRMSDASDQTKPSPPAFDFSAFPGNTLFHERRTGQQRRERDAVVPELAEQSAPVTKEERRTKKDRRRRIDPTTFEKQYTPDELEFMNAMQRFKESSGKSFPTHGEVLRIAVALGYRLAIDEPDLSADETLVDEPCLTLPPTIHALG